ncbi:hypothetical protein ALC53_05301 [Atta colombica]|uniref:Uncharacterized protein n=1 Tax=Atta colombica TaxID=520822 RepID=A0A195BI63_9HYME|nr:hypothetical protein ALC53_05301 [Atta colombica]
MQFFQAEFRCSKDNIDDIHHHYRHLCTSNLPESRELAATVAAAAVAAAAAAAVAAAATAAAAAAVAVAASSAA